MNLLYMLHTYFIRGNARSSKAKINIIGSLVVKISNIAIGMVFVPLLINYLDPTRYGIWITLSSVIAWFGFFNIGLGNGLRNKLTETLARGDSSLGKCYVSTTYAVIAILMITLISIYIIISRFLTWSTLLNSGSLISESELSSVALIVFVCFCMRLTLEVINSILFADQRSAFASLFDLVSKILLLIAILLLKFFSIRSMQIFGLLSSGIPVLVFMGVTVWLFRSKYRAISPSLSSVDFALTSSLFNLGIKFFFIQISALLIYQTNNIIITQLFGPEQVTPYNISYKYFSVLTMGFSIVLAPFWSAFTDAWALKDLSWISRILCKLKILWVALVLVGIIMLSLTKYMYVMWIGSAVDIPMYMSTLVFAWAILNTWNGIYSHLLNGLGKIKLQMILALCGAIINVPLAIFMGKGIGIGGILLANTIVSIPAAIIYPIQARKLLDMKATGIWNR